MPSETLREYLHKLGFVIDEPAWKNFQSKLTQANQMVEQLGKIAIVAGGALSAALLKTASEMEKLYFSAQRAETTVSGLMGIRFASEQIGISAEQASAAVENMATLIRTNPGLTLFFQKLGLPILKDNTQNFINLVAKLKELSDRGPFGHAIATQIAAQFGIDEQTLFMYQKNLPILMAQQKELNRLYREAGVDPNKAADAFHRFMVDFRDLEAGVEVLAIAFAVKILPAAEWIVHHLRQAVDYMLQLNVATHGWSTLIGGIIATLGGLKIFGTLLKWAGGLFGIGGGAAAEVGAGAEIATGGAAAAEAGGGGLLAGIAWPALIVAAVALVGYLIYHYRDALGGVVSGASHAVIESAHGVYQAIKGGTLSLIQRFEGFSARVYGDIAGHPTVGYGHEVQPGEDFSAGVTKERAAQLLMQDAAKASAAIQRMVHTSLNANQLSALTDLVYNIGPGAFARSSLLRDLNAGNFAAAANEFLKWDRANGVENRGLYARRNAERALFLTPVTMNQETNIHVMGGSANETAAHVAAKQRQVNGDMLRDTVAKVQ